ncbi:transcription termination factor Rho [Citricoccus muralis]|uniref:Transcription termination factor Rho n=1 Tax=Citricoccus muralis TaxID=169134 RepID=A0A3D9LBU0_9MICC|nr:transcription termination factor Rho [Citricoccus muralis]REE02663.1 transcription termination factor Rho [Citricoccus muralis]
MTETTELPTVSAGNSTEAPAAAATTAAQAGGGLAGLKLAQLQALASQLGITGGSRMRKSDLVAAISSHQRGGSVADRKKAEDTSGAAATAGSDNTAGSDGKATGADNKADGGAAAPKRRSRGTKTAGAQAEQKQVEQSADQKQADSSADQPTDQKQAATSAAGTEGGAPERPARRTRSRRAESAAGTTGEDQAASAETSSEAASESRNGAGDGAGQGSDGQQERSNERNARGDRNNRSGRGDRNDRNSRNDRSDRNNDRNERSADRQQDTKSDNDQQSGSRGANRNNDRNERNNDRDEDSRRNRRNRNRNDRNRNRRGRSGPEVDDTEMTEDDVLLPVAGILDVLDNYAFVRTSGYLPGPNDVYVSLSMVKKYGLRKGDAVVGAIRAPRDGESQNSNSSSGGGNRQKFNALVRLTSVNGQQAEDSPKRTKFNDLVPLYPQERLRLETDSKLVGPRVIDLVSPIGKGQRGLIVSPPKAGKTMILQSIANAVTTNNPEVHLMMVLVDERPEEVTDMQRSVKGEVIASTFDRPADDHTTVAELAIERAKRLVEMGRDVVVLLDSMTRLGRAYNLAAPASGRILSGGVDSSALYPPKRFFGAARNIENGGSLTILATALVETGSKMDEVIFEEFKGTGNMELRLSRQLADKRIFPAVDVNASGTRREENLLTSDEIKIMWKLRRVLSGLDTQQALEILTNKIRETQSNAEFLMLVSKTTLGSKGEK